MTSTAPSQKHMLITSALGALFFASFITLSIIGPAQAQSSNKGQPAFSFEGGKRIDAVPSKVKGMREYDAASDAASRNPGTGIVEVKDGSHINRLSPRLLSPSDPAAPANASLVSPDSKIVSTRSSGTSISNTIGNSHVAKKSAATTTVQMLGPDGKMQYKEVPFFGELASTKKAPAITNVKDGEGKVKEYDWVKKGR